MSDHGEQKAREVSVAGPVVIDLMQALKDSLRAADRNPFERLATLIDKLESIHPVAAAARRELADLAGG